MESGWGKGYLTITLSLTRPTKPNRRFQAPLQGIAALLLLSVAAAFPGLGQVAKAVSYTHLDDDDRNSLRSHALDQLKRGSSLPHAKCCSRFVELNQTVGTDCDSGDGNGLALAAR